MLAGDAAANGVVDRGDLVDVIHALGSSTASGPYEPRLDLNTDGQVNVVDLRAVLLRLGSALPSGQPIVQNSIPAIATDVVFDRLGGGGAPQAAAVTTVSTSRAADKSPPVSSTDQPISRRSTARRRRLTTSDLDMATLASRWTLRRQTANARRRGDDLD